MQSPNYKIHTAHFWILQRMGVELHLRKCLFLIKDRMRFRTAVSNYFPHLSLETTPWPSKKQSQQDFQRRKWHRNSKTNQWDWWVHPNERQRQTSSSRRWICLIKCSCHQLASPSNLLNPQIRSQGLIASNRSGTRRQIKGMTAWKSNRSASSNQPIHSLNW